MLIKELAERTGLTPQTIRFYEREGFLDQRYIQRRANNYRDYTEDAVQYILHLKAGQASGFTLAELKAFADPEATGGWTTEQQLAFLRQKIADINHRIAQLEQMRAQMTDLMHAKEYGTMCPRQKAKSR
jgi:MerR family transcriptional regulator, copper efflux regulator